MNEWNPIEERFDPTWPYTFKWGYDSQRDRAHAWRFQGDENDDGSVAHRAELRQRFGRDPVVRIGDQLGTASYIPEERKLDGTLVAPPEVQVHGYYGLDPHTKVLEWFEQQFPGTVVRRANNFRISKIHYKVRPDHVQIETDTYETPHQELAEVKAELAKQFPNHEILLPDLPEDIFAGRPSLLDREQRAERQAATRRWIATTLPDDGISLREPVKKPSLLDRLLRRKAGADMDGAMIGVFIPKEVGERIKVKGGEPLDNMHITLVYFTDKATDRDDWEEIEKIVAQVAAQHAKLVGKIGGFGVFNNDEDVLWASPSIPGLAELRSKLAEACEEAGFTVSDEHGWVPHITLQYGHKGKLPKLDGPIDLEIDALTFARGENKLDFKLDGHFEKRTLWEQQDWEWPGAYRFVTDGKETLLDPEERGEWREVDIHHLQNKFNHIHPDSTQAPASGWVVPTQDGTGYGIWAPTVGYGNSDELGLHELVSTLDKKLKKPTHFVNDWRSMTNPDLYALNALDS